MSNVFNATVKKNGKVASLLLTTVLATTSVMAKDVELNYWYSWGGTTGQNSLDRVKEFNSTIGKQKGIHVTANYQGTYEDLHQKFEAAYLAHTAPDVSVMEIASIARFANNQIIAPIDKLSQKFNINVSDFNKGLMANSYVDGTLYGLPYLRSTPILYINTTLLKKSGLDPKGPKTWEEFHQFARVIKKKTGAYALTVPVGIWFVEAFMWESGVSPLNKDETESNINNPEFAKFVKFFQGMVNEGLVRVVSESNGAAVATDWTNQKTAMTFNSTASVPANIKIGKDNGFGVDTNFMPKFKQYGVPTGGCNLVMKVTKDKAKEKAAMEFIKFMTAPEQAVKSTKQTGYLPSTYTALNSSKIQSLFKKQPQFKVAGEQLEFAHGRPSNTNYIEATKAINAELEAIWINNGDVNKHLTIAKEKADSILNL